MMPRETRSRRFVMTINNWTTQQRATLLLRSDSNSELIQYLIFGEEKGEHGTPHLQCYLETKKKTTCNTLREYLTLGEPTPWIQPAKGNLKQNQDYCSKGENVLSVGAPMQQGTRSDLTAVISAIEQGSSWRELWKTHPVQMIKFHGGLRQAFDQLSPKMNPITPTHPLESFPEDWPREMDWKYSIILWGASGIGKTSFARAILPKALIISHLDQLKHYDPERYDGIIFDDMSFTHIPREAQIHLVDIDLQRAIHIRYGIGIIPANTKKIFTTNTRDGAIFDLNDYAIVRRTETFELIK